MSLRKITDLDVKNKTVILRLDLNLPMKSGKFTDITRITRSIPTINYLLEQNAKIVIISHMGRPKGEFVRQLSLAPVVDELEKLLKIKVRFATDCIGLKVKNKIESMKLGELIILENLRFNPGEEKNDIEFARELSKLADVFINDTFSCSHRSHASIDAITTLMPSAAGFLLLQELRHIQSLLDAPASPFVAIVGGAKISTKLDLLLGLLDKVDYLILGGAIANTFLYASGYTIGKSMIEIAFKDKALEILSKAQQQNKSILLPRDFMVKNVDGAIALRNLSAINDEEAIMDIGPSSSAKIAEIVNKAATLVWNGPLGAFEIPPYNGATFQLARNISSATANNALRSIIGGGDTVAALKSAGLAGGVTYTSTGGGAFLQWLEGKNLPGISALLDSSYT
jgi:phosphoglycerate kinase